MSDCAAASLRVGIAGAGGIALGYAAMLSMATHRVTVWSPSGHSVDALAHAPLTVNGTFQTSLQLDVAASPRAMMAEADVVVIAVPAYGHRAVIEALLPHAQDGQSFVVSAQLSLSGAVLAAGLEARGVKADVAALATTVLMSRRSGPTEITVGGVRSMLELAALPAEAGPPLLQLCRTLFGDRFRLVPDIWGVALGNLNPPAHMASALCNFTRIEKGEAWANYDGITPSVARLIEALDAERLALAARFGARVRTVHEHYRLTFGFEEGLSLSEMAAEVHRQRNGPPGPTTVDTRFVVEDIPFGIVPLVHLADRVDVPMPLHRAGVAMFDALYGRAFAAENDLLPDLDAWLASQAAPVPAEAR